MRLTFGNDVFRFCCAFPSFKFNFSFMYRESGTVIVGSSLYTTVNRSEKRNEQLRAFNMCHRVTGRALAYLSAFPTRSPNLKLINFIETVWHTAKPPFELPTRLSSISVEHVRERETRNAMYLSVAPTWILVIPWQQYLPLDDSNRDSKFSLFGVKRINRDGEFSTIILMIMPLTLDQSVERRSGLEWA